MSNYDTYNLCEVFLGVLDVLLEFTKESCGEAPIYTEDLILLHDRDFHYE